MRSLLKFKGGCFQVAIPLLLCLLWVNNISGHTETPEEKQLHQHYVNLYNYYKENVNQITSDCKVKDSDDDDLQHHHWGTKSSLEFLSGKMEDNELLPGEKRINLKKLRKYLARIGYLKRPGSFLFLDKQTQTMRLLGCKDDSAWRQQGEKNEDKAFQEKHYVGAQLKTMSPNAYSYLHKYTCFSLKGKCSHTFYVISKPLPEMPLGLQVSEGKSSSEWDFTCTFPYCRIRPCHIPGTETEFPQRSYFPYTIKWDVPSNLKKKLGINDDFIDVSHTNAILAKADIEIKWEKKMRKSKDAWHNKAEFYTAVKPEAYVDGFGDNFLSDKDNHPMHSRIIVKKGDVNVHHGTYECIIWDENGVATTPSKMFPMYKGKANINVMPFWQCWAPFAAAGGCMLLTAVIILVCPRKMEYDDGTQYTKEDLATPIELHSASAS